ncbi:MAG: YtxH domain-containing protein [Ornithinimicrobium sp.]
MSKITLAAAAAAGYVLGARAGRERYDQLSERVESLWSNPKVQEGKRRAQRKAEEVTSDGTESSLSEAAEPQSDSAAQLNV